MDDALWLPYALAVACLVVGLALALRTRLAARARVGRVIQRAAGGGGARAAGVALLAGAAVCAVLARESAGLAWTAPLLALSLALHLAAPRAEDRVCGSEGVRRGWIARRHADLEEWRLSGDHLRFRLRGRWEAVPCAPEHHAALGERLRALAPERESAFK